MFKGGDLSKLRFSKNPPKDKKNFSEPELEGFGCNKIYRNNGYGILQNNIGEFWNIEVISKREMEFIGN